MSAANSTAGQRIYAIGDIHGELDKLLEVHAWIARDATDHGGRCQIIHLGDYTDRGPNSRGVMDYLASNTDKGWINLLGNHDRMFARYVTHPGWQDPKLYSEKGYHWLHDRIGGVQTLASYGIHTDTVSLKNAANWHEQAADAVPISHVSFLESLPTTHQIGNYMFIHAGIDPLKPFASQTDEDFLWSRAGWLEWRGELPFTVVHGHTVVEQPERYQHRINADTGAVFGNALTCVVLDGDDVGVLTGHNVRSLPLRQD